MPTLLQEPVLIPHGHAASSTPGLNKESNRIGAQSTHQIACPVLAYKEVKGLSTLATGNWMIDEVFAIAEAGSMPRVGPVNESKTALIVVGDGELSLMY